jgi:hypothetical protein
MCEHPKDSSLGMLHDNLKNYCIETVTYQFQSEGVSSEP